MFRFSVIKLILVLCLVRSGFAQPITYPIGCGFNGNAQTGQGLAPAAPRALQDVQRVAAATRTPVWEIYQGGVPNACATVLQKQVFTPMGPTFQAVPVIVYNPAFLQNAINRYGPWAGIGVLAHECGHHVNMDASFYGSFKHSWSKELEADAFAGYALAKLGASLKEAQQFQYTVYDLWGSPSHPDSPKRLAAVQLGWIRGGGSGSLEDVSAGSGGSAKPSSDVIEVVRDSISEAKDSASPSPVDPGFYVVEVRGRWWFTSVLSFRDTLAQEALWMTIQGSPSDGEGYEDWVSFDSTSDARHQRKKWIRALQAAGAKVEEVDTGR